MSRFASTVIRYRSLILAVVCIATLWFAFHATSLRMNPDLLSFLPRDDEDVQFFQETMQRFRINEINMIAIESDDIFTHASLTDLRKITGAVQKVRGVIHVLSLTNLLDIGRDEEGSTVVQQLIDPETVPRDPGALAALRKKVLSNPMLVGSLVSTDGRAAMLSLILDKEADKGAVAEEIRTAALGSVPGRHLCFGGLAMVLSSLQKLVARDMGRLMPLTVLAILLLLFLGAGSLRGMVLPLATVLLATVWSLGTMSLDGMELSMLTSVIPVVTILLGTAPGLYLVVRYCEEEMPDGRERTEHVLAKESRVLLHAGFVIAAGFLSLMLADLDLFRDFGKAATFGIAWSMVLSLTFLPACLAYLPCRPARTGSLASPQCRPVSSLLSRTAGFALRRRTGILAFSAGMCLAALALIPGIPRHMNLMAYFPEGSEPYEAETILKKYFGGSQLVQVNFRAKDVRAPAILDQMEILGKRLRLIPGVNYPQSAADVLKELNLNLNGEPGLPDIMNQINDLWFFLEGQPSIELLLDKHHANGVVAARIGDSDPEAVAGAVEQIRRMVEETVPRDLFLVELDAQPPSVRGAFQEELAARVVRKVALDVKFHTGRDLPEQGLAAELGLLIREPLRLDDADRQVLKKRIQDYLESDEADIQIRESPRVSQIAGRLAERENLSSSDVESALRETLPPSSWTASPEDLAYTADYLRMLFRQTVREKRSRDAMAKTLKAAGIPGEGPENQGLIKEIAADLWGVNSAHLGVDSETWFRITGRERPWESRVEFEVRLTGLPVINMKYDGILVRAIVKAAVNALVIVLVLLIFLLRSPVYGFAAVSPVLFSSLAILGTMRLLGMAVDNMTVVFLSLAMGASVLYALPFIARGAEGLAQGGTQAQVVEGAMNTRGRAILIHALSLALGFGILVFSSMAPLRQFGLFIALALLLGGLGTFFILPSLMLRRRKKA